VQDKLNAVSCAASKTSGMYLHKARRPVRARVERRLAVVRGPLAFHLVWNAHSMPAWTAQCGAWHLKHPSHAKVQDGVPALTIELEVEDFP
jgi:hypothetical protein